MFPQGTNYAFFRQSEMTISDHFSYNDSHLYIEWFTLDASTDQLSRTAMNLWNILGNVGGIQ